ncbi:hypothetical protein [Anaerocolumna xylanovorans]|uniref:ATPase involved in DNA repair n=1 Tax=Anaerocolumna xylanovorans DSM 12503 TaxID=1121345 RepID=A0A1M7YME9_9FIRM|nr:hypothetical protein [Anaerocolumna xylanovorans]SHO53794.1 hypothetical protein SAMN02745217_04285 [Anaerocolumna xylanovorans DSM 12503]
MQGNILSGGIKELEAVRQKLTDLTSCQNQNDSLEVQEGRLEKSIKGKEKDIADEIGTALRQRKEEIEKSYDAQLDLTRQQIKKIKNRKMKSKTEKVNERIENETAGAREEYRLLNLEIKDLYKTNHIPRIFHNRLFYAIFFPGKPVDFLISILVVIVLLLVLPYLIYTRILPQEKLIFLFLMYALIVIVFGGIYLMIESNIKNRHQGVFVQIQKIRRQMVLTRKTVKNIRKAILKDRDESIYDLEDFDRELEELEQELAGINAGKKEALSTFENSTRNVIREEINQQHQEELLKLKKEYAKVYSDIKEVQDTIKNLSLEIASEYEAYIGKELLTKEKLDMLIQLMRDKSIATISEAIAAYKTEQTENTAS